MSWGFGGTKGKEVWTSACESVEMEADEQPTTSGQPEWHDYQTVFTNAKVRRVRIPVGSSAEGGEGGAETG